MALINGNSSRGSSGLTFGRCTVFIIVPTSFLAHVRLHCLPTASSLLSSFPWAPSVLGPPEAIWGCNLDAMLPSKSHRNRASAAVTRLSIALGHPPKKWTSSLGGLGTPPLTFDFFAARHLPGNPQNFSLLQPTFSFFGLDLLLPCHVVEDSTLPTLRYSFLSPLLKVDKARVNNWAPHQFSFS